MNEVTIAKDGENEIAVPQAWRPTFAAIVDALIQGGEPSLPQVTLQAPDVWAGAQESIRAYGAHLKRLPDESWNSSVCIWYGDFWNVLVDLYTEEEGRSDLVLQAHVYEVGDGYRYEVVLVYVP
ncbi:DUF7668 domain-containing protein [Stenotrophomonas maltophilia]|uniref:DUF7668 domain-containing protein n=1 Tax=Stenotrophomonas maltophilia TaxID=40324 RepID=UPI0010AAD0D6|nr:hypothetical protein [Stenotrophomonas maltophilia]TIE20512.1 hypothetical protein DI034_03535 [Stenotrophomonas maltophilia]TIE61727.1 hypothetical protein DI041_08775 [Stenotrophomonas maltophilia]